MKTRTTLPLLVICFWALFLCSGSASAIIEVDPHRQVGPEVSAFGWDLKGWANHAGTSTKANRLYSEVPANMVRISMWATAHYEDGSVSNNFPHYTSMLNSLANIMAVNPDVKIFASLKLQSADTFPAWVESTENGSIFGDTVKKPDPVKYAQLVADYIEYMKDNGYAIDYLGIGNETEFALTADRYHATIDSLATNVAARGWAAQYTSYELVGGEAFKANYTKDWMWNLNATNGLDTADIIGSHYYPQYSTGSISDWVTLKEKYAKPLWHTELHLEGDESQQQNIRNGMSIAFALNKNGVEGFCWWANATDNNNLRHIIRRRSGGTMAGAHPVATSPGFAAKGDPNGEPLYQAYRRGSKITLWICNPGAVQSNQNVKVRLGNVGDITSEYWTGTNEVITAGVNTGTLTIQTDPGLGGFTIAEIPAASTSIIYFDIADMSELALPIPYAEGFENGWGGWTDVYDDSLMNWHRNNGYTPTAATGPSTGSDGSWYMYIEGHDDTVNRYKPASLQNRFDFSQATNVELSFDYHMFGPYIGSLAVDVFEGTWHSNVWSVAGQVQTAETDPWSSATVDLSAYAGNDNVIVSFRGVTDYWNAADAAIDNVRIDTAGGLKLPYETSFEIGFLWPQSSNDDFDWSLGTGQTPTAQTGPTGAAYGSWYAFLEADDDGGQYKTALLENKFDLSAASNPEMSFDYHMNGYWTGSLSVDVHDGTTLHSNIWTKSGRLHGSIGAPWSNAVVNLSAFIGNTGVTVTVRGDTGEWEASDSCIDNLNLMDIQSLPYQESFESGLGVWLQSTRDEFDWRKNSGGTPSANAGPSGAADGSQYLYLEADEDGGQFKTARLEGKFDFSTMTSPELHFDYHMNGYWTGSLSVDVFDGSTWNSNVWTIAGRQHGSIGAPWTTATVDLSAYAGNPSVTLCLRGNTGPWATSDTAIDNIRLSDSAYDDWVEIMFVAAPGGTDKTYAGNPDGDLLSNEFEWALVTDPMVDDWPTLGSSVNAPSNTFSGSYQHRNVAGIDVFSSWSYSLTDPDWRTDGLTDIPVSTAGDIETMEAVVPMDSTNKFLRIQAVR